MRFLILSNNYPIDPDSATMQSELAAELIKEGHEVDVLVLGWYLPKARDYALVATKEGANVHIVPVRRYGRLGRFGELFAKWFISPLDAGAAFRRHIDALHYDVVLAWTPCVLVRSALRHALRNPRIRSVLYIADFFPIHHAEIGLVPRGPIFAWAKRLEQKALRRFDIIFCNLPSNMRYLRDNYRLRPAQDVRWTPLWTSNMPLKSEDRAAVRLRYGLPADRSIAVFGGHIIEGRGIEQMLGAAKLARDDGEPLHFLFVGDGRLVPQIAQAAQLDGSNVMHIPALAREEYLRILAACDIGMLATVANVTSHSFPTKSMDFMRAGLPIVASVEPGSDFMAMIVDNELGTCVRLGDDEAFYRAIIEHAAAAPFVVEQIRSRGAAFLDEVLDVRHCHRRLIDALADHDVDSL